MAEAIVSDALQAVWDENNRQIQEAMLWFNNQPDELQNQLQGVMDRIYNRYRLVVDHLAPIMEERLNDMYINILQRSLPQPGVPAFSTLPTTAAALTRRRPRKQKARRARGAKAAHRRR